MSRRKFGVLTSLVTMLLIAATVRAEQDSVAAARDLYASAAYEDALAVLNRLPGSGRPVDETRTIEQYRAFCLLALGRAAEAEHAIESVISADPMYRPSVDLSPRVRTAFSDVRRRVLPAIIQQKYAQAKAAYDRKEYAAAADLFARVLETMSDPDVATQVDRSPLSDMKMLALGFKDLATTASAPPPQLPAAAPASAPVPEPVVPKAPRIYTSSDGDVLPPVVVKQDLPAYPGQVVIPRQGLLEVLIDENGLVESAFMRVSVAPHYDQLAVAAARTWRFRPATLNGAPVKYRKAVQVTIKPIGPPR
jgi:TonB family protein